MKNEFSFLPVTMILLFATSVMAQEFEWTMFLPAITSVDQPPVTVVSATGRVWMDRNLGASRVAASAADSEAYGDLYQWGRLADGHENRISLITSTLSTSDVPGHKQFILAPASPYDWRTPQNNNLWQGTSGLNNPCPDGFRLPTKAEWDGERLSWSSNSSAGAFASPLKLVLSGIRNYSDGTITDEGVAGYYWSSGLSGNYASLFGFGSYSAQFFTTLRASGMSVRCIKD